MDFTKSKRKTIYSNLDIAIYTFRSLFPHRAFQNSVTFGLTPIAQKPLIEHLLSRFVSLGFTNIFILCNSYETSNYQTFIRDSTFTKVKIIGIDDKDSIAQIIRRIDFQNHLMLYPIDLITSIDISRFFDFHVEKFSELTIFSTNNGLSKADLDQSPGQKLDFQSKESIYFVTDQENPDRLVFLLNDQNAIQNDIDLSLMISDRNEVNDQNSNSEDDDIFSSGLEIPAKVLSLFRNLVIDSSSKFMNLYLFSPSCLKTLKDNYSLHSLTSQFIPFLCSTHSNVFVFSEPPNETSILITDFASLFHTILKVGSGNFKCFSGEGGTDVTVNDQVKTFSNCCIASDLVFGDERNLVVRSVIGKGCSIGKGVRIFNSVIYDRVVIQDNVMIKGCLIGSDALIPSKSKLEQVVICPRFSSDKPIDAKQKILQRSE